MKQLIFLLIPLLFLSSCSIDWNDEKDKKISELEKQIQNDIFQKKQECSSYQEKIKWKYNEFEKNSITVNYEIKEIFYSRNKQTCILWLSKSTYLENKNSEKYELEDLLTWESLWSTTWNCLEIFKDESAINSCQKKLIEFNKQITELKWE